MVYNSPKKGMEIILNHEESIWKKQSSRGKIQPEVVDTLIRSSDAVEFKTNDFVIFKGERVRITTMWADGCVHVSNMNQPLYGTINQMTMLESLVKFAETKKKEEPKMKDVVDKLVCKACKCAVSFEQWPIVEGVRQCPKCGAPAPKKRGPKPKVKDEIAESDPISKTGKSDKESEKPTLGSFSTNVRKVVIELIQDQLGTVPKDPTVYASYIESKKPETLAHENESENVPADLEAKGWTGFMSDTNGLFIYDYLIKGFFKNAANQLKEQLVTSAMRSKVVNQLFVHPRKIYFGKTTPDDMIERPIQCQTAQGPRVSLARSDSVASGTQITFYVEWLKGGDITEAKILELLKYGRLCGLGQFRTGGYGRFKVVSFEPSELPD